MLGACAGAPKHYDYAHFRAEAPRSILVVPVTNKSVDVNAPDYFLATIATPLAERGYYVFPVNMVKSVLSDDGLSDANLVHAGDPRRLGELFGADAVMYITIERWDARYAVLSTAVTVELSLGQTATALQVCLLMQLLPQSKKRHRITFPSHTKPITPQSMSRAPDYPQGPTTGFSARILPIIDLTSSAQFERHHLRLDRTQEGGVRRYRLDDHVVWHGDKDHGTVRCGCECVERLNTGSDGAPWQPNRRAKLGK